MAWQVMALSPWVSKDPEGGEQDWFVTATLSEAIKDHVTSLLRFPGARVSTKDEEQDTSGRSLSSTVIPKLHEAVLAKASVAIQLITVVPTGKVVVPNEGQVTVAVPLASTAVARFQLTTPLEVPKVAEAVIFEGQLMVGGITSATRTSKLHCAVFLDVSVAVQDTTE